MHRSPKKSKPFDIVKLNKNSTVWHIKKRGTEETFCGQNCATWKEFEGNSKPNAFVCFSCLEKR